MAIKPKGYINRIMRVTKEQNKWIKQQARFQSISEAEVVRQLLDRAMKQK